MNVFAEASWLPFLAVSACREALSHPWLRNGSSARSAQLSWQWQVGGFLDGVYQKLALHCIPYLGFRGPASTASLPSGTYRLAGRACTTSGTICPGMMLPRMPRLHEAHIVPSCKANSQGMAPTANYYNTYGGYGGMPRPVCSPYFLLRRSCAVKLSCCSGAACCRGCTHWSMQERLDCLPDGRVLSASHRN